MVHEPAPVRWTLVPLMVQAPSAMKATGRPDDVVASSVKSAVPKVVSASGSNEIVWLAGAMARTPCTSWAEYCALSSDATTA